MTPVSNRKAAIIRTERGLTIAGTRITLYDVMDYLNAQYPPQFIRDSFNLTDEQINVAISYINTHQAEVETEYKEVLRTAEEIRQYWEERNREHFTRIAKIPSQPGYEQVRAKLRERKAQRQANK